MVLKIGNKSVAAMYLGAHSASQGGGGSGLGLPKYPNFPQTTFPIRTMADIFQGVLPSNTATVSDTDFIDGRTTCLEMQVTTSVNVVWLVFSTPQDFRKGHLSNWIKVVSGSVVANLRFYSAGTPSSPSANFSSRNQDLGETMFSNGWYKDGCGPADFVSTGTGADFSAVTMIQMRFNTSSGTGVVRVSDVQFVPNPIALASGKAKVVLCGDDAFDVYRTTLKPLLDPIGAPFTCYPGAVLSAQGFGNSGRDTLAQAQAEQAGNPSWQIANQAGNTEAVLTTLADYIADLTAMQNYNKAAGWYSTDSADGSYPSSNGPGTPFCRQAKLAMGERTMRRFVNGNNLSPAPPLRRGETFPPRDETNIIAINAAQPGLTGSGITTQIGLQLDRTVANLGVLFIAGHNDWSSTDEVNMLNYLINRKQTANDFDFTTPRDLLKPYEALYGTRSYASAI